ncbi:hypothetical protein AMTRI_Chr08g163540 [Amborella trichopoda]|uniref:Uncharacterized protein n=1 Tax=Amborella trichopoda TaxID=13333 RepID=W1PDC1_AMBTC|nr:uncharacterized protein LOC18434144 [Amborella trichopoda]ERN05958.1 hypothetical protein AMTR_s00145p00085470 [Amborella trichopoda]|eukprot:XP_006844283.1 uncharacterized protein LOC18434144 [Amborella trichopoda]
MEGVLFPMAAPLWSYQEKSVEELRQILFCKIRELELTRIKANEHIRRNEEQIRQLVELLKKTCKERDEARDQLQSVLNNMYINPPTELCPNLSNLQPNTPPPPIPTSGGASTITESDSLSGTHKSQAYVSSPVESLFTTVSSMPDIPSMNFADSDDLDLINQLPIEEFNSYPTWVSSDVSEIRSNLENDTFENAGTVGSSSHRVLIKSLPERGKFLQAVMEAGPLLQTLLVAGPLPRWRNPPPLERLDIPPVGNRSSGSANFDKKPVLGLKNHQVQCPPQSLSCNENSFGFINTGLVGSNLKKRSAPYSVQGQSPVGKYCKFY